MYYSSEGTAASIKPILPKNDVEPNGRTSPLKLRNWCPAGIANENAPPPVPPALTLLPLFVVKVS